MNRLLLIVIALTALTLGIWNDYRIGGLERRLNVHEASEHWQEEPPK